jgi:manganese/iron transport system ATP-binding protein
MTRSSPAASLEVTNLTVAYSSGHVALRDATFSLHAPTICGLVGMNGSGKSTLFKAIMGFVRPTRGQVAIMGLPVREAHKRSTVAYVPQAEDVDWAFPVSVWDVVLMGRYGFMNMLRIPARRDKELATQALERVGMIDLRHRQIGELSGGQKKRVFLARALAQEGSVILLDEPFTGVDVQTEQAIVTLLRQLRDSGRVILVSTHNLGSVPEFCDEVVILNRTVLASGPVDTTFTADNLARAFGGVLRHLSLQQTHRGGQRPTSLTVLTDDEGALVIGSDGRVSRPAAQASLEANQQPAEERGT